MSIFSILIRKELSFPIIYFFLNTFYSGCTFINTLTQDRQVAASYREVGEQIIFICELSRYGITEATVFRL